MSQTVFVFPDSTSATLAEVGGKGLSLIQGSQAGLPVPPGFILSVHYFLPWIIELQQTKTWHEFLEPEKYDLQTSCTTLKKEALQLSFTREQEQDLSKALQDYEGGTLFAVRSSSPEEDLEGASFAGGYETVLGVSQNDLHTAIKKAFVSCLDYRVTVYKKEKGFNTAEPKIAVIIQQQIPSEVAGVGFSLNPVTNNFDEAVFTSNFGLGETVVQGIVTPDTYTVEKISMHIKNKQLGAKQISIWLLPDGGTKEKTNKTHKEFTLSDAQVLELTELIKNVESLYKKPIDIEWAFAREKLYLLQARPITGFVPLPAEMITDPGKRKRFYLDLTISVQGITHPVSIMATSFFKELLKTVGQSFFNRDLTRNIAKTPAFISSGRMYFNLSVLLHLLGRKRLLAFLNLFDPLTANAISEINDQEYISHVNKLTLLPWKIIFFLPRIASRIMKARSNPDHVHTQTQKELNTFVIEVQSLAKQNMPVTDLADQLIFKLIHGVFLKTVPLFITATLARSELKKIIGKDSNLFDQLDKALPHNPTTQMGLALFHVSELLPEKLDKEKLLKRIKTKELPEPFLNAWESFLSLYGFRGPEEIDVAAPRYQENPELLLDILLTLRKSKENTQKQFEENQKKRKQAYETVLEKITAKDPKKAKQLKSLYSVYETFAGYRETHKYYAALVVGLLRQRILQEAKNLYEAKRIDSIEQVFDLTLQQLDNAIHDPSLSLRELVTDNKKFIDQLAKVPRLPTLITSRGLILKSHPKSSQNGEVTGIAVSPGTAQGKVKTLHSPSEKPFLKGEILVARATDPGWTPLFVNASAVILEVGGMLQHGALVAREYGLPCVTGIENATNLWKDGTLVEVNGTDGKIREVKS